MAGPRRILTGFPKRPVHTFDCGRNSTTRGHGAQEQLQTVMAPSLAGVAACDDTTRVTRISELTIPYVAASGRPHHACGPLDGYEIHLGRTVPEAVAPLSMPLVDADYGSRAERDGACRLMAASSAHTFDWLLEDSRFEVTNSSKVCATTSMSLRSVA